MEELLSDYINRPSFPCVMAKAVISKGFWDSHFIQCEDPLEAARDVLERFYRFVFRFQNDPKTLSSFTVTFNHASFLNFDTFDKFFWEFLEELNRLDKNEYSSDPRVSNNPASERFSFSVRGEAFFMLVLHPESPRLARRFAAPTVVFNAHQQFEDLREKNIFEKVRDSIRRRDKDLQGFINPMLTDYGSKSEVFQYTGRVYPRGSKCPFKQMKSWISKAL